LPYTLLEFVYTLLFIEPQKWAFYRA